MVHTLNMSLLNHIGHPGLDGLMFVAGLSLLYLVPTVVVPVCLLLVVVTVFVVRVVRTLWEAERVDGAEKHVLITGCDTGIGFALARLLDRKGFHVFATCLTDLSDGAHDLRRCGSSRMRVLQLDVTSDDSVERCLKKVQAVCGDTGLWALVNNAGTSLSGDVEIQPMSNFKKYADINLFGVIRTCKAFLPLVRKRKGRVVNVTSVRGRVGFPMAAPYTLSKFGVEGFSDALRQEMKRFGVKVIIVEPGSYGLYVGHMNEKNRKILVTRAQEMVDSVGPEVRSAYGEDYLQTLVSGIPRALPFSEDKLKGVLDALESATAGARPRSRYLADSSNLWVDTSCVMARLKDYLPEYLMDSLVFWIKPLKKEAYSAMKTT